MHAYVGATFFPWDYQGRLYKSLNSFQFTCSKNTQYNLVFDKNNSF